MKGRSVISQPETRCTILCPFLLRRRSGKQTRQRNRVQKSDQTDVSGGAFNQQLKHIRIIASDIALLKDVSVEISDGIKDWVEAIIATSNDGSHLELRMKDVPIPRGTIHGDLIMKGIAFAPRTLSIEIREKPPIEIFPKVLYFGSKSEGYVSATSIVKLRNVEIEKPQDDLRVACSLPDGKSAVSTLTKLSRGIYRLSVEIPKTIAKEYGNDTVELSVAFKTSNLDEVLIGKARFTW